MVGLSTMGELSLLSSENVESLAKLDPNSARDSVRLLGAYCSYPLPVRSGALQLLVEAESTMKTADIFMTQSVYIHYRPNRKYLVNAAKRPLDFRSLDFV